MSVDNIMSVRFFPWWNNIESDQVIGLINMLDQILSTTNSINTLVEIGSHLGESTTIFLGFEGIKKIYCIDPWHQNPIYENIFNARLEKFITNKRCNKIKNMSNIAVREFADNSIDMIYIDGNHDYESVKEDIELWYPKIIHNGILSGHDYTINHPGTKKAVDKFIELYNFKLYTFRDTSWYIIKEKI